jgi:hypothetical protein
MLFGAKHLPSAIFSKKTGLAFRSFCHAHTRSFTAKPIPFAFSVRATGPLTDQPWVCGNSWPAIEDLLGACNGFEKSFELARFVEQTGTVAGDGPKEIAGRRARNHIAK